MSQEQVLKTLMALGLTRLDSEVYIFLSKKGPLKGIEITSGLKAQKQPLYRSLKNLQSKGIVTSTLEHPSRFTAVSFDKVVDMFIKTKMAEAQSMQENKSEILAHWQAISIADTTDMAAKFNLIEGRGPIYSKILQMMKEAHQLSTITSVAGLLRANQFGLFDEGLIKEVRAKVQFRALTELSKENIAITKKLLREITGSKISFEGRTPEFKVDLPQLVIKDQEEILFFITSKGNIDSTQAESCVWTNCKSLVQAFTTMFENFWGNAKDIIEKMDEIENNKTAPKMCILNDSILATNKYNEVLEKANREIIITTTSQGLNDLCLNKKRQKEWQQKKLSVKIMAPITGENQNSFQKLKELFEVRHIPTGYLGMTLVDGDHLFQFKDSLVDQQGHNFEPNLAGAFYRYDSEYIQKTRTTLNDLWHNAPIPSGITLDSIASKTTAKCADHVVFNASKKMIGHVVTEDTQRVRNLTEKAIIERIIEARKNPNKPSHGITTIFSTNAQAIIHPPKHLKLPDLLFHSYHIEKHSTYGEEDALMVHLWLETPVGYVYVPSALITDNPMSVDMWKKSLANTPAHENVRLVKKDELHTSIHGLTLFVGWTIQIPLLNNKFSLPPSCLLVEGYGNIRTDAYKASIPSGFLLKTEGNIFEAFVTYLHPASNYSGPGTDGAFGRDIILELHPPGSPENPKNTTVG
jgi:sugar-specific transcriptional regulator TrmB